MSFHTDTAYIDPEMSSAFVNCLTDNCLLQPKTDLDEALLRLIHVVRIPGGPKKRYPGFNFAITSVNVHRF